MTNAISKRNIGDVDTTSKIYQSNSYGPGDPKRYKLTHSIPTDRYSSHYPPLPSIPKTAGSSLQHFRIDESIPQIKNSTVTDSRNHLVDELPPVNAPDTKSASAMMLALIDASYPPLLCPSCKHVAANRTEADHHYRSNHHGERNFVCMHPYCQQAYSSKGGLRYHLEHMHNVSLIPESNSTSLPPIINRPPTSPRMKLVTSLPSKSRMSEPLKKQNPAKRERKRPKPTLLPESEQLLNATYNPLVCPVCRSSFKRKTNVINHLVDSHHGEEPYHCVIVGCTHPKAYATREGLVYHIANYHDREASGNDSGSR
ncbi:hypothetical protein NQZ79_g127 [Umbelopsis isabellina]|nr:hypothetical protein NQZ79_g127 [Umbelopsis isabellina]